MPIARADNFHFLNRGRNNLHDLKERQKIKFGQEFHKDRGINCHEERQVKTTAPLKDRLLNNLQASLTSPLPHLVSQNSLIVLIWCSLLRTHHTKCKFYFPTEVWPDECFVDKELCCQVRGGPHPRGEPQLHQAHHGHHHQCLG